MLTAGAEAPDFTASTADGAPFTLSSLRGRPVVLYFYPKANSPGCTVEARGFTEHFPDFVRAGIAVVGVSADTVGAQARFREKCAIPYPLVADRDRSIARSYGVLGLLGMAKRVTFFLNEEGRIVEVLDGILPRPHVRRALERLTSAPSS